MLVTLYTILALVTHTYMHLPQRAHNFFCLLIFSGDDTGQLSYDLIYYCNFCFKVIFLLISLRLIFFLISLSENNFWEAMVGHCWWAQTWGLPLRRLVFFFIVIILIFGSNLYECYIYFFLRWVYSFQIWYWRNILVLFMYFAHIC